MMRRKKRLMLVAYSVPKFDRLGSHQRLLEIVKALSQEYAITYLAQSADHGSPGPDNIYVNALRPWVEELKIVDFNFSEEWWKKPEVIYFYSYYSAFPYLLELEYFLLHERRPAVVIDTMDLIYRRNRLYAEVRGVPGLSKRAERWKAVELDVLSLADMVIMISDEEKKILQQECPEFCLEVVPNFHEYPSTVPSRRQRRNSLLFVGSFAWYPNADAASFFIDEIWPFLAGAEHPIEVDFIGEGAEAGLLAKANSRIRFPGHVSHLNNYLTRAAISIVPMRFGSGLKNKIGEAMAWGLPVITTPVGDQGFGLKHAENGWIAHTPAEFAQGIQTLLSDSELWERLHQNGRALAKRFTRQTVGDELRVALNKMLSKGVKPKNKIPSEIHEMSHFLSMMGAKESKISELRTRLEYVERELALFRSARTMGTQIQWGRLFWRSFKSMWRILRLYGWRGENGLYSVLSKNAKNIVGVVKI